MSVFSALVTRGLRRERHREHLPLPPAQAVLHVGEETFAALCRCTCPPAPRPASKLPETLGPPWDGVRGRKNLELPWGLGSSYSLASQGSPETLLPSRHPPRRSPYLANTQLPPGQVCKFPRKRRRSWRLWSTSTLSPPRSLFPSHRGIHTQKEISRKL